MLLLDRGWHVRITGNRAHLPPAVLVNPPTCDLLRGLWRDPGVLAGGRRVRHRIVRWAGQAPVHLPDPGLAIETQLLLDRLEDTIVKRRTGVFSEDPIESKWLFDARGRPPQGDAGHQWAGSRHVMAAVATVDAGTVRQDIFTTTSVHAGWVSTLPLTRDAILVQAMVPQPAGGAADREAHAPYVIDDMLSDAGLTALTDRLGPIVAMPAAPGIMTGTPAPGRLPVGDRALAVDPISGDGVGHGVRSALLAVATVLAITGGHPPSEVLKHYRDRHRMAFHAHLRHCLHLYGQLDTETWRSELRVMRQCLQAPDSELKYRLCGQVLFER